MLLEYSWILDQLLPVYGDYSQIKDKVASLGVSEGESHVPFMVLFAIIIELIRTRNDECCGLLTRSVPFGTMEMLLRTMSTARSLESAAFTLVQSADLFHLPYKIILRDHGPDVFVELVVSEKKDQRSMLIEFGYLRFIWASFCWFVGRNIGMSTLYTRGDFFTHDHRDAEGRRLSPFRSTVEGAPSWGISERAGFTLRKAEFKSPPALSRDSHPLIEAFKWCGTLNLGGQDTPNQINGQGKAEAIPAPFYDVINDNIFGPQQAKQVSTKEARILRAKVLLSSTPKTTAQIAYDLGYSADRNFRDTFKRATGQTPIAYREVYEKEDLIGSDHLFDQILKSLRRQSDANALALNWIAPRSPE